MAGPIPPNPTELVSRNSLDMIFEILKSKYDYIIIDTAPVGLVTDTLLIARVADMTVYICRADYTAKSSFDLINGLSSEKKLPNIAIAINGIDMAKKSMATTTATANTASMVNMQNTAIMARTVAMAATATILIVAMATRMTPQ